MTVECPCVSRSTTLPIPVLGPFALLVYPSIVNARTGLKCHFHGEISNFTSSLKGKESNTSRAGKAGFQVKPHPSGIM